MRQIKISIRTQLLILVLSTALFSLLVLAIVTGVYFTNNSISTSLEKLQVISQLKSSQLRQTYDYNYYQLSSLLLREDLKNTLTNYKAGNTSANLFAAGKESLQEYIDSTENFYDASLYSVNGETLIEITNSVVQANMSDSAKFYLKPLGRNNSVPLQLRQNNVLLSGPVLNESDSYLFSITLPVYANSSILISTPDLAGYMTVVINASSMRLVTTDTDALVSSKVDIVKGITSPTNISDYIGFVYAFAPAGQTDADYVEKIYSFDTFPLVASALQDQTEATATTSGAETKIKTLMDVTVALGYSVVNLAGDYWIVFVQQDRANFLAPSNKLAKIIVGIVIGLSVLVCLVTIPLAHYGVRPIMKLRKATEELTYGRGLGKYDDTHSKGYSFKNSFHSRDGSNISVSDQYPDNNNISTQGSMNGSVVGANNHHFKIPHRITLSNRMVTDELSELTELFNVMTDELDRQYTHLEDRVRERTRELEKLKIRAESADELKTVFISQISHELRTPLNGILGLCSVCLAEDDPTSIKESLKLIFRSGELLLHILTELLTFSKNTLKKSKLENKDFKILDLAWQIKSIFGKLAFDQNVDLRILIKPNFVRKMILFGDSNRITQVLMNLVSNSLKFTPIDGKVDVFIRCLGEYDEERSKLSDYKKVFIKCNSMAEEKTGQYDTVPTSRRISKIDQDDLQSLHTITTSEYNNAIFESQFKNRKRKNFEPNNSPTSTTDVGSSQASYDNDVEDYTGSDSTEVQYDRNSYEDFEEYDDDIKHYKLKPLDSPKKWVIEFTVQDTGPGIEPALKDKVFEPFIQGDQTLSRSHGGTGLGLSICRQLLMMMNGTLELEGNGDNETGSKFIFRIPLPQVKELIVTSKRDEKELYNDEFNPDSKRNRKVKIVEPMKDSDDVEVPKVEKAQSNPDLLKLDIPLLDATKAPLTLQLLPLLLQSPSLSIQSSSYFVDKPTLLTKSSTGTAHSLPMTNSSDSDDQLKSASSTTTPKSAPSQKFNTMSSPNEEDDLSRTSSPQPTKRSLDILVAEDNQVNQEVIKRMLNLEGFKTIKLLCDGQELIDLLKLKLSLGQDYDLIFMDVQMPKLDGVSATKYIRADMNYKGPIVALTLYLDESNVQKCLESGMSGFLAKPIRRTQLKKIILEFGYGETK